MPASSLRTKRISSNERRPSRNASKSTGTMRAASDTSNLLRTRMSSARFMNGQWAKSRKFFITVLLGNWVARLSSAMRDVRRRSEVRATDQSICVQQQDHSLLVERQAADEF